jgi:hypothetical protein
MNSSNPPPLFILGAPRSFTSVISTMLGQHPQAYGMRELNLFLEGTVRKLWARLSGPRQFMLHGLLRSVAQLYAGEQDTQTVDMARRWIMHRLDHTTCDLYHEMVDRVAPLLVIDKSPAYCVSLETLHRLDHCFDDARYLHLVRHPISQGRSIMQLHGGRMLIEAESYDFSTIPPTLDPQYAWISLQNNILNFLGNIPPERKYFLRGEEFLGAPSENMRQVCQWLGLSSDEAAIEEMYHPERSPYAHLGPFGAHLGNDINFLNNPNYEQKAIVKHTVNEPLPWRTDGKSLLPRVKQLAEQFGYE